MTIALITGSAGLIGAEAARFFSDQGLDVVGIDNDMRRLFFGDDATTHWSRMALQTDLPRYRHNDFDIRDQDAVQNIFGQYGRDIAVVIHAAAQPSHDWAAREPRTIHLLQHQQGLWRCTKPSCPLWSRATGGKSHHNTHSRSMASMRQ